jgi:hypothetical protein
MGDPIELHLLYGMAGTASLAQYRKFVGQRERQQCVGWFCRAKSKPAPPRWG